MLDPNHRSMLADAIRPPAGYKFSAGVALTYSLDLTTLLTVPVQLALLSSGAQADLLKDPVALLEALRRTTAKLAIVCQRGRIHVPGVPHVLYALLEKCVIEVNAPNGGVFHPKLWALRYDSVEPAGDRDDVMTRLVVLSRNLTPDRSWDLSLVLEGHPHGRPVGDNRAVGELLTAIREMVDPHRPVPQAVNQLLTDLADQVRRTPWDELPDGYDSAKFTVLGLQRRAWKPQPAGRLAVLSPFVSAEAIAMLAESTDEAVALVSRPEELAHVPINVLKQFKQCLTLHDQAETDDGEDVPATGGVLRGLHAKAFIAERGWYTTLAIGSANATSASLLDGRNVELLVELTGKKSKVGGIDRLLGPEGIGGCLVEFTPPPVPTEATLQERAERQLEQVRDAICGAAIRTSCRAEGLPETDAYLLSVQCSKAVALDGVGTARIWPVSLPQDRGVDARELLLGHSISIGPIAAASLTSFLAFELVSDSCDASVCFVLSVPTDGIPTARDAAVLRTIVSNREGFLRYLLLLLRDDGGATAAEDLLEMLGSSGSWNVGNGGGLPLLEELTKAFARDPNRLLPIKRMVDELLAAPNGSEIVPAEFLELWHLYEAALDDVSLNESQPEISQGDLA